MARSEDAPPQGRVVSPPFRIFLFGKAKPRVCFLRVMHKRKPSARGHHCQGFDPFHF